MYGNFLGKIRAVPNGFGRACGCIVPKYLPFETNDTPAERTLARRSRGPCSGLLSTGVHLVDGGLLRLRLKLGKTVDSSREVYGGTFQAVSQLLDTHDWIWQL
jgi:hypothetical protein